MNPFLHVVPILAQVDATTSGQTVTVSFNINQVVTAIIVGLIAGALASVLVRGRRFGFLGSIILGILGAVVGGFLFSLVNFVPAPGSILATTIVISLLDIVVAFVGALIILILFIVLFGRRSL
ncbi:MAG TPA: GlsB/YeaQ/YmgE family stress response membrane protein [Oceanobacillus sp.]|nr:GlsB/YeaQ/YmgE family stress response membrane protein [Oceanobacillus sp.]